MTRPSLIGRVRTYPILFTALALLSLPASTWAAADANMYITGGIQGAIQGEVTTTGRENSIQVVGYGYNLSADFDQATGLTSGQRQHRPVRVVKPIDKASPLLFNALVNNENLTVTIHFWRSGQGGAQEQYYTVTLTNAHIVGITPTHSSATDDAADPATETISFTFQTIATEFETTGAVGTDTWTNP